MKKRIKFLLFAGLTTIIFSACEKDDVSISDPNKHVSIHGLDFEIGEGVLFHHNDNNMITVEDYVWNDIYDYRDKATGEWRTANDEVLGYTLVSIDGKSGNFMISLYEKGISRSLDLKKSFGRGAVVSLQFASSKQDELVLGEYDFGTYGQANTFFGYSSVKYDFSSTDGNAIAVPNRFVDGSASLSKDGDIYTITYNCTTATGSVVEGKYEGTLKFEKDQTEIGINHIENVSMTSATDTLIEHSVFIDYYWKFADEKSNAFLISSKGQAISGLTGIGYTDAEKRYIDLACMYDKVTNSLRFTSPLYMRGWLHHGLFYDKDYYFPCHTVVDNNPDITVEQFDAIANPEDFSFEVEETDYWIPLEDKNLPRVIVFKTGNGIKGAIKLTEITDYIEWYQAYWWDDKKPINSKVKFDLKTMIAPAPEKIK